jgi:Predicted Zn-dependent proteases and their inactivated homologs
MYDIDYLHNVAHKNNNSNKVKLVYNQNRAGYEFSINFNGQILFIPFYDLGVCIETEYGFTSYNEKSKISETLNIEFQSSLNLLNQSQLIEFRNEILSLSDRVVSCCISKINTFDQVLILPIESEPVSDIRKYCSFRMDVTLQIDDKIKTFNIDLNNNSKEDVILKLKLILSNSKLIKFKNKKTNLLFDTGTFGVIVHEIIGHLFEEDLFQNSQNLFDIKRQFNSGFTIIEGRNQNVFLNNYNRFDDRGLEYKKNMIFFEGKFRELIVQNRRENYRCSAIPRMNCTYLNYGPHNRDYVLKNIKNGILVKNIIGGYIEPDTYKVYLYINEAYKVSNGNICGVFEDFVIQSDVYTILDNEALVCDDLTFTESTCLKKDQHVNLFYGSPSVLLQNIYF